ncbi:hypothetical protein [Streptomyces anulatus]|uniref:hypothetical protein n=1 Tax=Streptomyces anulatus TaxID=1892 RepID=UPI002E120CB9|nr:hypothetical protein OG557_38805 [Streptomyces anulatus]
MTAQGEDVLAFLERMVSKLEANADRWHDAECSFHDTTVIDLTVLQDTATLCDCQGPAGVRRRCAADRKLIAQHGPCSDQDLGCKGCGFNNQEESMVDHYEDCPVLCALAEGYGWTEGER